MTTLRDVGNLNELLNGGSIFNSSIWDRSVSDITPGQLALYKKSIAVKSDEKIAATTIETIVMELMRENIDNGLICDNRIFQALNKPFTLSAGELNKCLRKTDLQYRRAMLFALEHKCSLAEVVFLSLREARRLLASDLVTPLGQRILKSQPIYFRWEYVFWLDTDSGPEHLLDLSEKAEQAFGVEWDSVLHAYDNLIMIDETIELRRWQDILFAAVAP